MKTDIIIMKTDIPVIKTDISDKIPDITDNNQNRHTRQEAATSAEVDNPPQSSRSQKMSQGVPRLGANALHLQGSVCGD